MCKTDWFIHKNSQIIHIFKRENKLKLWTYPDIQITITTTNLIYKYY